MIETNMINADEIAKLDQIDQDCRDLHVIPPPRVHVELEVRDADGNVIQKHAERAKSWVRNFYNYLMMCVSGLNMNAGGTVFGAGSMAMKETAGTTVASAYPLVQWSGSSYRLFMASSGVSTNGIVVGTSNAAESFESHAMGAQLTNGTGTGNISYQAEAQGVLAYNSSTKVYSATLSRVFNNNTASLIQVRETGIIGLTNEQNNTRNFLFDRNVLSTSVDVPVGGQLTVNYVLELTFPA